MKHPFTLFARKTHHVQKPILCLRRASVLMILFLFQLGAFAQSQQPEGYEPGLIYLKIKDSFDIQVKFDPNYLTTQPAVFNPIFAAFQVTGVEQPFRILGGSFGNCYRISHATIGQEENLIATLKTFGFVAFAERVPHDVLDVATMDCPNMNDPLSNYYMGRVNGCEAYNFYGDPFDPMAARTLVAVVDDAVMTDHQDIDNKIVGGWDISGNDPDPNPPFALGLGNLNFFDHGTAVASVVGAEINNNTGVTSLGWYNDIMPIKCQHDQAGEPGAPAIKFYDGVARATADGARVINMSWSSFNFSQMNYDVIKAASAAGIILVGSAGNTNDQVNRYPGAYGEGTTGQVWEQWNPNLVLSVGALDASDNRSVWPSGGGSNFNNAVDVSAYGTGIQMAEIPHGTFNNNLYYADNGTSFSAPQVSALAGLLWSYRPSASPSQIIGCIVGTANPDIYGNGHNSIPGTMGSGRIDAYAALRCLATDCADIPAATITPSNDFVCSGGTTMLTASQGTAYQWSSGQSTQSIGLSLAGTYTVTVTYTGGCTATDVIDMQAAPATMDATISKFSCTDRPNVLINGFGSSFMWSINQGAPFSWGAFYDDSPFYDFSYSVTISDAWGCPNLDIEISGNAASTPAPSGSISISENSAIPNDGIICGPQNVTLTANGGMAGATYQWFGSPGTTQSVTVVPTVTTTYYVTITNPDGCIGIGSTTITVNPNFTGIGVAENSGLANDGYICSAGDQVILTAVSCPGNTYTYLWSTAETTQSITVNPTSSPGNYYAVTITNPLGNTVAHVKYIWVVDSHFDALVQETSGAPNNGVICAGFSATIGDPTPIPGFTYTWDNGMTGYQIEVSPTTTTTYHVTYSSPFYGCTYSSSITVTVLPTPDGSITISENSGAPNDGVICAGTTVTLTAGSNIPGSTYLWNNGLGTNPVVNVTPTALVTTYTVTITSPGGCSVVETVTISMGAHIQILENSGVANDGILCFAGEQAIITAAGSPGATYTWNTGATTPSITVNPLLTTTYTVDISDPSGCKTTRTIIIEVLNANPTIQIVENSGIPNDGIICAFASAQLQVSNTPGATYMWSTSETSAQISVSPMVPTTYTVTITMPGTNCSYIRTANISVIPSPNVVIHATENSGIPNDGILCSSTAVILTAATGPGTTYLWSTGATTQSITVTPTVTSTYSVTVTSSNGCTSTAAITIVLGVQISIQEVNSNSTDGIICQGRTVIITASGSDGYAYNWSTGQSSTSITVTPSTTTTYTVTATDNVGMCTVTASVTIEVVQDVAVSLGMIENSQIPNDGILCQGASVELFVQNPKSNFAYTWNTGAITSSIMETPGPGASIYAVTVTIGNACTHQLSQFILAIPAPAVLIGVTENSGIPNDAILCGPGTVVLSATHVANATYQWSNGLGNGESATASPNVTTTYQVTITPNNSGCSFVYSQTVTINQLTPTISIADDYEIPGDGIICTGGHAVLTSSGGGTYMWSTAETQPAITVSPTQTTLYTVTVTDAAGCSGSVSTSVTVTNCNPTQGFACPCSSGGLNINASSSSPYYDASLGGVPYAVLESIFNYDLNNDGELSLNEHNNCIAILGTLIVNQNLTISSCDNIQMQPCSEIVVGTNTVHARLELTDNFLFACTNMWKGIRITPFAALDFSGNTIRDAEFAIKAVASSGIGIDPPTEMNASGNTFANNHVGVLFQGNVFTTVSHMNFTGNTFTSTANLLPPCDPALHNYNSVLRGFAGIVTQGTPLTVGIPGAGGISNFFSNIRNGITSSNSVLNVSGGEFQNILGSTLPNQSSVAAARGIGIVAAGGTVTVTNSIFNTVTTGIFGFRNQMVTIRGNNMEHMLRGIELRQPRSTDISDNPNIGFTYNGILCFDLMPAGGLFSHRIANNTHMFLSPYLNTPFPYPAAIEIDNFISADIGAARVTNNHFFSGGNFCDGIRLEGAGGVDLDENQIIFEAPASPFNSNSGFGVRLTETHANYLYHNTVQELDPILRQSTGFSLLIGADNRYCCNITDRTRTGSDFFGACNGTEWRSTDMTGHSLAIFCAGGTVIDPQFDYGNLFKATSGTAFHGGDNDQILNSRFRVVDMQQPNWPVAISTPNATLPFFVQFGSAASCSAPCTAPQFGPYEPDGDIRSSDQVTATTGWNSSLYGDVLQFESVRQLYHRMHLHPEMAQKSTDLETFYKAAQEGKTEQFYAAEQATKGVYKLPDAMNAGLETALADIQSNSTALEALLSELSKVDTHADSMKIFQQANTLLRAVQPAVANLYSFALQEETYRSNQALYAHDLTVQLTADNVPEQNRKAVQRLYLQTAALGLYELNPQQILEAEAIAVQCPHEGGSAVYVARLLYNMQESRIFSDSYCMASQERNANTNSETVAQAIRLMPNPATDEVKISGLGAKPGEAVTLFLMQPSGYVCIEKTIESDDMTLSVANLSPGVYFCKVQSSDGQTRTVKFVIAH